MHRVELKVLRVLQGVSLDAGFLMHRVELKDQKNCKTIKHTQVPNAPCGVER